MKESGNLFPDAAASEPGKICRPYITLRNGRRLYAYQYGLKAFCFVPKNPKKPKRKN
jgi:hypothetical protein